MDLTTSEISQPNCERPSGLSLARWMGDRLALRATRHQHWETFAGQAEKQPKHARAQIRYITPGNHSGAVAPGTSCSSTS